MVAAERTDVVSFSVGLSIGKENRFAANLTPVVIKGLNSSGELSVTKDTEGKDRPLGREKFYVPGSVLRVRVNPAHPLAWGLAEQADVMFSGSPTFRLPADAEAKGLERQSAVNPIVGRVNSRG